MSSGPLTSPVGSAKTIGFDPGGAAIAAATANGTVAAVTAQNARRRRRCSPVGGIAQA
jgi:DNA-binding beta-propeller fold protein YncE